MAAFRAYDGSLHTANTAADHCDMFLFRSRLYFVFFRLHDTWHQSAAGKTTGVAKILIIRMAFVMREVKTAIVTADTRANIFQTIFHHLVDPLGISKELTGNTDCINTSICDSLRSNVRLHTSGTNNRDIYELLDMRNIFQIAVLWHILRRMRPIPGIVSSIIAVEHIVACILKIFCSLFTFFHITTNLCIFFARNSTYTEVFYLGLYGITQGYREVITAGSLDCLYNVCRKTISVFK